MRTHSPPECRLGRLTALTFSATLVAAALAFAPACNGTSSSGRKPALVQFASATFTVAEDAGTVTIAVRRQGQISPAVGVEYATSDSTALDGVDYLSTFGTLTWAAGDGAEKTFTVQLLDDGCAFGDVSFGVTLSNPSQGLVLGANDTATVTIVDDEVNAPGTLDPAFGTGGAVSVDPSSGYDTYAAVAIDGGFLYAVAFDEVPATFDWRTRIEKRSLADGSLDPAFGTGGVAISDPSIYDDSPWDVAVDGGFVFVVGYDESPNPGGGDWQWRIEKRSVVDAAFDPGFGNAGVVTTNPTSGDDEAQSVAIDGGFLYVGGYDLSPGLPDWQWRLEKRSAVDGALDPAFGTAGVVESNRPGTTEIIYDVAVDATHVFAAGWDTEISGTDRQWRVEKRGKTDGALDPAFGAGGILQINPGNLNDMATAIALDATHFYVGGTAATAIGADTSLRVEKRSLVDGALEPLFGSGGVVVSNPSMERDELWALRLDGGDLFLGGNDEVLGLGLDQWRLEKRSAASGALDTCFGTNGVVVSDPSPGFDAVWGMAVDATSVLLVGEDQTPTGGDEAMRIEKYFR